MSDNQKPKASKLDDFADQLDEWFKPRKLGGEGLTLKQAVARLSEHGVSVSSSWLGEWAVARREEKMRAALLSQISSGAQFLKETEKQFSANPAPETKTLINLLRVLVMKLTTQAHVDEKFFKYISMLMGPVMDALKLEEKAKSRELNEAKFKEGMRQKLDLALDELVSHIKGNPEAKTAYDKFRSTIAQTTT